MKLSFRKKLNQAGMLSLHVVLPVLAAVVIIGGVGAYVVTKSKAATPVTGGGSAPYLTCSYSSSITKPIIGKPFTAKVTIKNIGSSSFIGRISPSAPLGFFNLAAASNNGANRLGDVQYIGSISANSSKTLTFTTDSVPRRLFGDAVTKVTLTSSQLKSANGPVNSNCYSKTWSIL